MSKKQNSSLFNDDRFSSHNLQQERVAQIAHRFNRQYQNKDFELPKEVETMPIFMEWLSGKLSQRIASPFWEMAQPQKNQSCLDIGCGVSFLIYPWRDWQAFFYGQEISTVARDVLNTRAPQLNSKLFKGVELGAAHQLNYQSAQFDLAIATGWSCYFPLDYWKMVMSEVKGILKPSGQFVFDLLDPQKPLAEDWAILETYLGAEVFLEPLSEWEKMIKAMGAKIVSRQSGELFEMYKVRF
jgi:SAM-dependent methyltransferase